MINAKSLTHKKLETECLISFYNSKISSRYPQLFIKKLNFADCICVNKLILKVGKLLTLTLQCEHIKNDASIRLA